MAILDIVAFILDIINMLILHTAPAPIFTRAPGLKTGPILRLTKTRPQRAAAVREGAVGGSGEARERVVVKHEDGAPGCRRQEARRWAESGAGHFCSRGQAPQEIGRAHV